MSRYFVTEVTTRQHEKDFLILPKLIHINNPHFVRHLDSDIQSVFSDSHLQLLGARANRWIVYDQKRNQPVGKIAAFYSEQQGKGMGFFDSIPDQEVASLLFKYAELWLTQWGPPNMPVLAPVNLGQRDSFWGLLVEGFESPSYKENYNPPYYAEFFEYHGFVKDIEQITYSVDPRKTDLNMLNRIASRALKNTAVEIKPLDKKNVERVADDFIAIYNQAWSVHEHFKPLNKEEMLPKIKSMLPIAPAMLNAWAYVNGKPAGFFINILEINPILKGNKGYISWLHKLKMGFMPRSLKKLRGIVFGVVPEFQKLGLETAMIQFVNKQLLSDKWRHIEEVEISWIGDFNPKMMSLIQKLGARESKIHYTFKKEWV